MMSYLYWLQYNNLRNFKAIHLFYCVNSEKESFFQCEIKQLINKLSFVQLHLINADKGQLLSADAY